MARKHVDPFFWIMAFILRSFSQANLNAEQTEFVEANIRKHSNVIWVNALASTLVVLGLSTASQETIGNVIMASIAPVGVFGTAWFAISFGGVPRNLMHVAMSITFWMFSAFVISLSTMFGAVAYVVNPVLWPVLVFVYAGALVSCILYDTADGLKIGLDEAVLHHSRYAISYYKKEGVTPEE